MADKNFHILHGWCSLIFLNNFFSFLSTIIYMLHEFFYGLLYPIKKILPCHKISLCRTHITLGCVHFLTLIWSNKILLLHRHGRIITTEDDSCYQQMVLLSLFEWYIYPDYADAFCFGEMVCITSRYGHIV